MNRKSNLVLTGFILVTVLMGTKAINSASFVMQEKGKLAGVVIDPNGARVKGAHITVRFATEEWKAISGEAGEFEIELPVKLVAYNFTVKANGFCSFEGEQVKLRYQQTEMVYIYLAVATASGCRCNQDKKAESEVVETFDRNCESNNALMYAAASLTVKMNSRLFVISRLGAGETRQRLGHRRLHNVRAMFASNGPLGPDELITAEGERVKGPGRVDFYRGGELVIVATFRRNADFCVDCCEWDQRYYGRGKTK